MKTIHVTLLGAAGTGTAFAAATALRRHWSTQVRLILMDINPRHLVTSSVLGDVFEQVPLVAAREYAGEFARVVTTHSVDTYLPLFPAEIALTAQLRKTETIPASLLVLGAAAEAAETTSDKWLTARWLEATGLPTPLKARASEAFASDEYFLKPRNGTGSRGARRIKAAELGQAVGIHGEDFVVQELCDGPEVTVDAFHDPVANFTHSVCRERIETKAGVTTKARLFHDAELNRLAQSIGKTLPFAGSFCFQVMRAGSRWVVTDLNARPGAATAMCALTGNDFFAATFARAWGEPYQRFFRPLEREVFVTRQYAEFITG